MKKIGVSSRRTVALAIAAAFFGVVGISSACEGEDYGRTLMLLDESLKLGWQCGRHNNCDWERISEVGQKSQQLPASCQRIIEKAGAALQRYNTSDETHCYGDVCCGPTGCA